MINMVRLYKKAYLPLELVSTRGNSQTQVFNNIKEKS